MTFFLMCPIKLKLSTHMDIGWMYRLQSAASYLSLYFFISVSLKFPIEISVNYNSLFSLAVSEGLSLHKRCLHCIQVIDMISHQPLVIDRNHFHYHTQQVVIQQ